MPFHPISLPAGHGAVAPGRQAKELVGVVCKGWDG